MSATRRGIALPIRSLVESFLPNMPIR